MKSVFVAFLAILIAANLAILYQGHMAQNHMLKSSAAQVQGAALSFQNTVNATSSTSSTTSSTSDTTSTTTTTAPPALANVTFYEIGLPVNATWVVNIDNSTNENFAPAPIGFSIPNGTYEFYVAYSTANSIVFSPLPANEAITVNGPASYVINFAPKTTTTSITSTTTSTTSTTTSSTTSTPSTTISNGGSNGLLNVTFYENGLPYNATWTVRLGNATAQYPAPDPIIFRMANGTYQFTVSYSQANNIVFAPLPLQKNITVNGSISYVINFAPQNAITSTTVASTTTAPTTGTTTVQTTSTTTPTTASTTSTQTMTSIPPQSNTTGASIPPRGNSNTPINITLYETGLPGRVNWTVSIGNTPETALSPGKILFSLATGTYNVSVWNLTVSNQTFSTPNRIGTVKFGASSSYIINFTQSAVSVPQQTVNALQVISLLERRLNFSSPTHPNKGTRYTYTPQAFAVIPYAGNSLSMQKMLNASGAKVNYETSIVVAGNISGLPGGVRVLNASTAYANLDNLTRVYTQNVSANVSVPILYGDSNSILHGLYLTTKFNAKSIYTNIGFSSSAQNSLPPPNNPVYSYMRINSTVPDSNVTGAAYVFAVNASWMYAHGIAPDQVTMLKYVNGNWVGLPTSFQNSTPSSFVFRASSNSLSMYAVSFTENGAKLSATTNVIVEFQKGFTTYFATCSTGGYTVPASSFIPTVKGYDYAGATCGGECGAAGYQTFNTAWCHQSTSWYEDISGIGANVIPAYASNTAFAVNDSTGTSTALTYKVAAYNSFVVIAGGCAWEDCPALSLPSGCTQQNYEDWGGQTSAESDTCVQNPGTYTVTMSASATPETGQIEAYVFAPYNVLLNTVPSTAGIQTNNNIQYANGMVMNVIGTNPLNATAPSSGTWRFVDWASSNAVNVIISNTLAQDTFATVEGNGNILASFNGLTVFTETGLPSGTAWNAVYNGNTLSTSSNSMTFDFVPGLYPYTVANQIVNGNTYVSFPQSGTANSGDAVSISFSKLGVLTLTMNSNTPTYDQSDVVTATAGTSSNTVQILIGAGTGPGTAVATGTGSVSCNIYSTCDLPSGDPMPAGTYNVVGHDSTSGASTAPNPLVIGKAVPQLSLTVPGNFYYTGGGGSVSFSITTYNSLLAGNLYVNNALDGTTKSSSSFTTSSALGTYAEVFNTPGNGNYISASLSNSFTISPSPFIVTFTSASATSPLGATANAIMPANFLGYYCNAGTFTTFSASKAITWLADVNETDGSSPPNAVSSGHQSSSTCTANAVGAASHAGVSVAGLAVNQTNYYLFTQKATGVTSNTIPFTVSASNSFVIIQAPSGAQELLSVTIPGGCVTQQLLSDDYAGNPGAASYIATCLNMASGAYAATENLKAAGSAAEAVYVFSPFNVVLDSIPSTANIETNGQTYANGLTMNVIGTGTIQTIAPSDASNYIWSHWSVSNSVNLTVYNAIAITTSLNVAGNGILTANYNGLVNFVESGLPGGTTWNVIYNGQLLSSSGNTITFNDVVGPSFPYAVANQISGGNLYGTRYTSGNSVAPNTIDLQFVTGCSIQLAPNSINFGGIEPGSNTPTSSNILDSNLGPAVANILVSGTNWIFGANSYFVTNTLFDAISQVAYAGIPLPLTPSVIDTLDQTDGFSSTNAYFGTAVPKSQASGAYTQNIIIENSC